MAQHGRKAGVVALLVLTLLAGCKKAPNRPEKLSNIELFDGTTVAGEPGNAIAGEAPLSLTDSEGSGLKLTTLDARVVIDGPLALTELRLAFDNPEARTREGRFAVTLPAGAAVSRFAMKMGETWQEGEVVERKQAERIYEDFLHRKQDPAFLAQDSGNIFRARVFPIPPNAKKELIISWSQELPDANAAYVLPLAGLPAIAALNLRVYLQQEGKGEGANVQILKADSQNRAPAGDLHVWPGALGEPTGGFRVDNIALARVTATDASPDARFGRLIVLFDTSASQSVGFEAHLARLAEVVAFAGAQGATDVTVLAFDQVVDEVYKGTPAGFGAEQKKKIQDRMALGASDLGKALHAVVTAAQGSGQARVILVSDGMATAGERKIDKLKAQAAALGAAGVQRLDVVCPTEARDADVLVALTQAGLAQDGVSLRVTGTKNELAPLAVKTLPPIDVAVPGANWVWPKTIRGLQAGQSALVYADLPPSSPLKIELSGGVKETFEPKTRPIAKPLLERAWVGARIRHLLDGMGGVDPDLAGAAEKQATELSVKYRVLSPQTALLVLETEDDYARYNIDRTALADILSVSPEGAAVLAPRKNAEVAGSGGSGAAIAPKGDPGMPTAGAAAAAPAAAAPAAPAAAHDDDVAEKNRNARESLQMKTVAGALGSPKDAVSMKLFADDGDGEVEAVAKFPSREPRAQQKMAAEVGTIGGKGSSTKFFGEGDDAGSDTAIAFFGAPAAGSDSGSVKLDEVGGTGRGFGERGSVAGGRAPSAKNQPVVKVKLYLLDGGGDAERREIARKIEGRTGAIRACYEQALRDNPMMSLKVKVTFTIGTAGAITDTSVSGAAGSLADCIASKFQTIRNLPLLPAPQTFSQGFAFSTEDVTSPPTTQLAPTPDAAVEAARKAAELARKKRELARHAAEVAARERAVEANEAEQRQRDARHGDRATVQQGLQEIPATTGALAEIRRSIAEKRPDAALDAARKWQAEQPGDMLAFVALGEALQSMGLRPQAARAYGSIIDLYPSRADLRRYAGNLLEEVGESGAALALDTYKTALEQRSDHPSSALLYALALARQGQLKQAVDVLREAGTKSYPRFNAADRTLKTHRILIERAAIAANGPDAAAIREKRLVEPDENPFQPSLDFVLTWETDANDVDFHIFDRDDNHASYRNPILDPVNFARAPGTPPRGELFADQTDGYGPECFWLSETAGFPYHLYAQYYSRGPMGYGMGRLLVIRSDGHGKLDITGRPFVIMADRAWVDMGEVVGM